MGYEVIVCIGPNYDFPEGTSERDVEATIHYRECALLADAPGVVAAIIGCYGGSIGAGNLYCAEVYLQQECEGGRVRASGPVAGVSWNGRLWGADGVEVRP